MLRLHHAPDNASLIIRIALEEIGLAYDPPGRPARLGPEKRRLPRAQPARPDPGAGNAGRADLRNGGDSALARETRGRPGPAPGRPGARGLPVVDGRALERGAEPICARCSTPSATSARPGGHRRPPGADRRRGCARRSTGSKTSPAPGTTGSARDTPSVLDIYVAVMLRWIALYPEGQTGWFRLARWPALAALAARLETRPAVGARRDRRPRPHPAHRPPTCPGATDRPLGRRAARRYARRIPPPRAPRHAAARLPREGRPRQRASALFRMDPGHRAHDAPAWLARERSPEETASSQCRTDPGHRAHHAATARERSPGTLRRAMRMPRPPRPPRPCPAVSRRGARAKGRRRHSAWTPATAPTTPLPGWLGNGRPVQKAPAPYMMVHAHCKVHAHCAQNAAPLSACPTRGRPSERASAQDMRELGPTPLAARCPGPLPASGRFARAKCS